MDTRPVVLADVELVTDHRTRMFAENGKDPDDLARMGEPFRVWLASHIRAGQYSGWVMEEGGAVAASGGIMFIDWPPHFSHPEIDRRAYVLNIFVEPDFRGRGLAQQLMKLCEDESRARGVSYMVLHASPMGAPFYDKMGWVRTNEMALDLNGAAFQP
ncbi:hypothetical protein BH09PSE2_BH09PSE2_06920 [soil metagenome]